MSQIFLKSRFMTAYSAAHPPWLIRSAANTGARPANKINNTLGFMLWAQIIDRVVKLLSLEAAWPRTAQKVEKSALVCRPVFLPMTSPVRVLSARCPRETRDGTAVERLKAEDSSGGSRILLCSWHSHERSGRMAGMIFRHTYMQG